MTQRPTEPAVLAPVLTRLAQLPVVHSIWVLRSRMFQVAQLTGPSLAAPTTPIRVAACISSLTKRLPIALRSLATRDSMTPEHTELAVRARALMLLARLQVVHSIWVLRSRMFQVAQLTGPSPAVPTTPIRVAA